MPTLASTSFCPLTNPQPYQTLWLRTCGERANAGLKAAVCLPFIFFRGLLLLKGAEPHERPGQRVFRSVPVLNNSNKQTHQ